ncbi:MAG: hypothetical protein NVSMB51_17560 [Solirubrobacteraceae bacterium]
MPATHRLAALVALALALAALAGCASPTHPAAGITAADLQLTRQFGDFTIYWVGTSFHGIPLTAADSELDYDPAIGMRMYYGDCDKHTSPLASVGCKLPLEVTTVVYTPHSNEGLGPQHKATIRGVPAVVFDGGKSIELYTSTPGGNFAIDVYADTPARARLAARELTPANRSGPFAAVLPPPRFKPGVRKDPRTAALAKALRAPKPAILHNRQG